MSTTDVAWYRIQCDGSTVKVWALGKTEAAGVPTESEWSAISATPCFSGTDVFRYTGGKIGVATLIGTNRVRVDDFTLKSYNESTSAFDVTEFKEHFTIDGSGYTSDTLTYDNNGNLTYDGLQYYTYDGWNRMKTVAHGYREATADGGDGNVHSGQVFSTTGYDAAGRRITKAISGTGSLDCTYHYYLSGQSVIEERNGSDQSIKDHVWGLSYIDETVQTRINSDPAGTASWTNYWPLQDANYNVLGVVNDSGVLVERYEYKAYGDRQVFTSAGSNDPDCYAVTFNSKRVVTSGSVSQPYGINEIGHQGLMHEDGSGLVYNRARMLNIMLGRFMQNDPLGYADSPNGAQYLTDNPVAAIDWEGTSESREGPLDFMWLSDNDLATHGGGYIGYHKKPIKQAGCYMHFYYKRTPNSAWLKIWHPVATWYQAPIEAYDYWVPINLPPCDCSWKGLDDLEKQTPGILEQIMHNAGVTTGLEQVKQMLHDNANASMNEGIGAAAGPALGVIANRIRSGKTLVPGEFAGAKLPARGTGRDFTKAERDAINAIGRNTGCHTCGSKNPGTKSGNFIPDHQPPSALGPKSQDLYPHCINCSRRQGGEIRAQ